MANEQEYRNVERRLWQSAGLEPTEQWIRIAGVRVRIQVVGDGPAVLLVHGGPNSGSTWAPLLPSLAGFRCLVVDRPGTGLSEDFVLKSDVHAYARAFVPTVLDELGLKSAHVVASSFGGFIALMSAAASPERVHRMVQMACPAFVPGMILPGFMKALTLAPVRWLINTLPPNEKAGRSIMRQLGHGASLDAGRLPSLFFEWYTALQRWTNTMRNDGAMIGSVASPFGVAHGLTIPDDTLQAVTTPTLFLWGADDPFGGEAVARHIVELMPHASVRMLAASGHLPWLDDPVMIGSATAAFLEATT